MLVIIFLGGIAWIGSHDLDPAKPLGRQAKPLNVQVVSLDWKWLFIYPEQGVATVNHVVVPAGRPINFRITSSNVLNVFFIPRLGSMIYAMPGMVSQVNLQADRPAELWGQSAHFSGDGFSDMQFEVKSVTPAQFAAWAGAARGGGPVLDRAAYDVLLRQSEKVPVGLYSSVDPMLFDDIVTQKIAPGPGPQPDAPHQAGLEVPRGEGH